MVNIGLVGCAHIHTPGFVASIKKRQDLRIAKAWDPNPARAQRWGTEAGATAVADVNEIWKDKNISAVIICSETNLHQELVAVGARAKKNLFVEKPLGMGAKDSFAMAKVIEKAGVIFSTGYFQRGRGAHLWLKEQIANDAFGQITRIRGSNCHSGALGNWFAAKPENVSEDWRWMADPAVAGVGAFGDLGTHALDIMIWLMGEVDSVTAVLSPGTKRYEKDGTFCDETGEGLIKFKNGAIGTLAAAWDDVANPVWLLISGTEGHAAIINDKLYVKCEKLGLTDDKPFEQAPQESPAGIESWLNAIAGDATAKLVSVREAAYRPAVMEAMYKGARTSKWIVPATMK